MLKERTAIGSEVQMNTQADKEGWMNEEAFLILGMNNMELAYFIEEEQLTNPMLELDVDISQDSEEAPISIGQRLIRQSFTEDWEDEEAEEEFYELPQASDNSLVEYLAAQIQYDDYDKEELQKILRVIQHIDEETGYLLMSEEELKKHMGLTAMELESILTLLRSLEPAGVGSEDLIQCLLIQIRRLGHHDSMLEEIIRDHLQDIAGGNISSISRHLNLSTAKTKEYLKIIRSLNPKPAKGFGKDKTEYIIPDVRISKEHDRLVAEMVNPKAIQVKLNQVYQEMAKEAKEKELVDYFDNCIKRARLVIGSIEKRNELIKRIAEYIALRQESAGNGLSKMPFITAEQLGLKLQVPGQVVEQAVKGKYLESSWGLLPMTDWVDTYNDKAQRRHQLSGADALAKKALVDMVKKEDKKNPYSDQQLIQKLNELGYDLSKRTLARYREELGLGNKFERRLYT